MPKLPLTLWTPYYAAATPERQAELDECLQRNLACQWIDKIVLLIDDGHHPAVTDDKLRLLETSARPTYRQWLEDAMASMTSGIALLANSDIYFDDTLSQLDQVMAPERTFMALTRLDRLGDRLEPHANPQWSQDSWAVRFPTSLPASLLRSLDIPLGVPRCDNKVAYLFALQGWPISNPFPHIRGIHVHETQQRSYVKKADDRVMGGVAYVYPNSLLNGAADLDIDIWKRGEHRIGRLSINTQLDAWQGAPSSPEPPSITPQDGPTQDRIQLNIQVAEPKEAQRLMQAGTSIAQHGSRFQVYQLDSRLLCVDRLSIASARVMDVDGPCTDHEGRLAPEILAAFVPPLLDTAPIHVADRPRYAGDIHFWQYPAATERQAYLNHRGIPMGANLDREQHILHTYLALPWATYRDSERFPEEALSVISRRLSGLRAFCAQHGLALAVHSVCQTIHWRKLIDRFKALGITDLHLSHCEQEDETASTQPLFRIHSWPLIAVNLEAPGRSEGLVRGKPQSEKRYLASFIGAHMKHYPSDLRLRLAEKARQDGGDDILVEVTEKWHFNDTVFVEQVQSRPLTASAKAAQTTAMQRYNEVLGHSIFSLCPEGAGPNTLRVWESLGAGVIPVIISDRWKPPLINNLSTQLTDCCVFIQEADLDQLFDQLRSLDTAKIARMSQSCMDLYEQIRKKTAF